MRNEHSMIYFYIKCNYPVNCSSIGRASFTKQDAHEEVVHHEHHISQYHSLQVKRCIDLHVQQEIIRCFIVAKNEEAKARKLRSQINAISRRCWGVKKSIWQFVNLPLGGSRTAAEASVSCQQSTLPEIKGQWRPEGRDVDVSIQRPHFGN